jgi:hypothetical protein
MGGIPRAEAVRGPPQLRDAGERPVVQDPQFAMAVRIPAPARPARAAKREARHRLVRSIPRRREVCALHGGRKPPLRAARARRARIAPARGMWIALNRGELAPIERESVDHVMIPNAQRQKPAPPAPPPAEREPHVSLRLKLWLGCVAGGAIAGLGSMWVLGTRVQPGAPDPAALLAWLSGVAFAAVLVGLLLALWLDHHIVAHLRGLLRGLRSGRVAELRGLPAASGWGELSELTEVAQEMLARQRRTTRAAEELEQVRTQITALQRALDHWLQSERWQAPKVPDGPLSETADVLARGFSRRLLVDEQNAHAARQVAIELAASVADAQESAEQAERGFVEATAMLTTVRELQRLSGELQQALVGLGATPAGAGSAAADDTRAALEALVEASQQSVDSIGRGMLRVQDVSELVQQLSNRATLVAIHAVAGTRREESGQDVADELKQLVQDVREATDLTARFSQEIQDAVAEASERMRVAREQAAGRLGEAPAATPASPRALDDAQRLLERVREMVQDATRKGERLSAAGERASRAAERLSRRVAEESTEAQALVVRMMPVGAAPAAPARELRLLEGEPEAGADPSASDLPRPREEDAP